MGPQKSLKLPKDPAFTFAHRKSPRVTPCASADMYYYANIGVGSKHAYLQITFACLLFMELYPK